ncbi:Fc.00g107790.m01.CDS01 [Cosmosporella sp. VM-42]
MLVLLLILLWAPSLNIESDPRPATTLLQARTGPVLAPSSPLLQPSWFTRQLSETKAFLSTSSPANDYNMEIQQTQKNLAMLKPHLTLALLEDLRNFWYEHLTSEDNFILPNPEQNKRWFFGGKDLDDICVKRFAPTLEAIRASGATTAHDIISVAQPRKPLDWLSLILLLDQMPRNCYRGDKSSIVFQEFDPIALQVAMAALEEGIPDKAPEIRWRFAYRSWFYLPLMHSEASLFHDKAMELYGAMEKDVLELVDEVDGAADTNEFRRRAKEVLKRDPAASKSYAGINLSFEKKHNDIIKQFGRYPHRNKALGRESTKEETEYLENGGETFSA